MSSNKYRVEQGNIFLGYHSGNSTKVVVNKAIDKYGAFYPIDKNKPFTLTKGLNTFTYMIN